jgi:dienelactone hydrolase
VSARAVSDQNGRVKRTAGVVAIMAMLAVGLTACLPAPAPPPDPVSQIDASTLYGVGTHQIELHDFTRGIAPYGDFPGSDVRTIPTMVFYPVSEVPYSGLYADHAPDKAGGPYPMVLFVHGFGVDWQFYTGLLGRIATAGYVVVAPTYPLLSGWPAGPTDTLEWDEHFTDTSFVISAMEQLNQSDPFLGGLMDMTRIATVGHSDGALIAYGAGEQAYRTDPRVRAVVSYAADLGFGDGLYQASGRPFLHYFSEFDEYNPYPAAIYYDRAYLQDPHWSITLWGATHAGPYVDPDDPHFDLVSATTIDFLNANLKGYPESLIFMAMEVVNRPDLGAFE